MNSKKFSDYDLIIFDCDGTLVDSHEMNHAMMAELANEYGDLSYTAKTVEDEFLGVDYFNFFRIVSEKEGVQFPEDITQRCVQRILQNASTMVRAIGGVEKLLSALKPHYEFAIASNANRDIVLKSLEAVGIDHYFEKDRVVAGRLMATPKPAPDLFLMAAERSGQNPDRCLVIEDSVSGVRAGVAAGMDVLGVTSVSDDPKKLKNKLLDAGAKVVFADIIHICEYLGH